ncbi:hypothetical protein [Occultella glacieicola]|uniref:hypothetical protein n=1 Tax=Occultella glacieicola TaxID=2518684 RepID=UPI001A9D718C|nr:hypothetical protein [Occultella glacieicola]
MSTENRLQSALERTRAELDACDPSSAATSLPHLRAAVGHLADAVDEAMAMAVLEEGTSLRAAGALAGLSENAVPPRLGRTAALASYRDASGRVSARGVERARYDVERGDYSPAPEAEREPMRFRPRRPD